MAAARAVLPQRRASGSEPLCAYLVAVGRAYAQRGYSLADWFALASEFRQFAAERLIESLARTPARLRAAIAEVNALTDAAVAVVTAEYNHAREKAAADHAARDAAPPALEIGRDLLMLPVAGRLHAGRVEHLRELLLNGLERGRARSIIVDFTGTVEIDPQAADAVQRALWAARMLGATIVLAGLGPQPAQTLARAGLRAGEWTTANDLRDALAEIRRRPAPTRKT